MIKTHLENLLREAVKILQEKGELPALSPYVQVDATKDHSQHGDYSSNLALLLARPARNKPQDIAKKLVLHLPNSDYIQKIEIAGPGFINFFLSSKALGAIIKAILSKKGDYGKSKMGREKKVLVEFLSSNPTGPLHVGHGRHAAVGAVISNMLDAIGFKTYREYYVNDDGRQMDILTASIWMRYLEFFDKTIPFPSNGYRGGYIIEIAKIIKEKYEDQFQVSTQDFFHDLPKDEPQGGDKEQYIDVVIERAKALLGAAYETIFEIGLDFILSDIREDLAEFRVHFDNWFSEKSFCASPFVDQLINYLKEHDYAYKNEDALWFRSTSFGDSKDRVLVRSNGKRTYFANDFAYHINKFERGFDLGIDIFGSDHHGYIPRMKAGVKALNIDPERLMYLLVQFVSLSRNGQPVSMSTRGGEFVTLRDLRKEVGNDAARFFYVMRKCEQPMDFDLALAKSQTNDNPVYYVQYAYARICSVFKQLSERQFDYDEQLGIAEAGCLTEQAERQLLNTLARYENLLIDAALQHEPHQLTNYLRDLAADFHSYYNSHQFLVSDPKVRHARLALIAAAKQILLNGFELLGITAPETM